MIASVLARGGPAELAYEHLRPHEDPALWIPDAVAWCFGAGGDWRRRISALVEDVVPISTAP